MRGLPNIEKSGFARDGYTGYAAGIVWRIRRAGAGWIASPQGRQQHLAQQYGDTLQALSATLTTLDAGQAERTELAMMADYMNAAGA